MDDANVKETLASNGTRTLPVTLSTSLAPVVAASMLQVGDSWPNPSVPERTYLT